jgi:hypothetical protein
VLPKGKRLPLRLIALIVPLCLTGTAVALALVPGDPTSYLVDGRAEPWGARA